MNPGTRPTAAGGFVPNFADSKKKKFKLKNSRDGSEYSISAGEGSSLDFSMTDEGFEIGMNESAERGAGFAQFEGLVKMAKKRNLPILSGEIEPQIATLDAIERQVEHIRAGGEYAEEDEYSGMYLVKGKATNFDALKAVFPQLSHRMIAGITTSGSYAHSVKSGPRTLSDYFNFENLSTIRDKINVPSIKRKDYDDALIGGAVDITDLITSHVKGRGDAVLRAAGGFVPNFARILDFDGTLGTAPPGITHKDTYEGWSASKMIPTPLVDKVRKEQEALRKAGKPIEDTIVTARGRESIPFIAAWLKEQGLSVAGIRATGDKERYPEGMTTPDKKVLEIKDAGMLKPGTIFSDDDKKNLTAAKRAAKKEGVKGFKTNLVNYGNKGIGQMAGGLIPNFGMVSAQVSAMKKGDAREMSRAISGENADPKRQKQHEQALKFEELSARAVGNKMISDYPVTSLTSIPTKNLKGAAGFGGGKNFPGYDSIYKLLTSNENLAQILGVQINQPSYVPLSAKGGSNIKIAEIKRQMEKGGQVISELKKNGGLEDLGVGNSILAQASSPAKGIPELFSDKGSFGEAGYVSKIARASGGFVPNFYNPEEREKKLEERARLIDRNSPEGIVAAKALENFRARQAVSEGLNDADQKFITDNEKGILRAYKIGALDSGSDFMNAKAGEPNSTYASRGGLPGGIADKLRGIVGKKGGRTAVFDLARNRGVTALAGGFVPNFASGKAKSFSPAKVLFDKVHDGDSLIVDFTPKADQSINTSTRLKGYNAPELKTDEGQKAKDITKKHYEALSTGSDITSMFEGAYDPTGKDKYLRPFFNDNELVKKLQLGGVKLEKIDKGGSKVKAASGFIPNFNALKDSVGRERAAGYSASQIRIGSSKSLVTSSNPGGMGVYNSTERNLAHGISLARGAGIEPKTKGASKGFIPNFAVDNDSVGSTALASIFLGAARAVKDHMDSVKEDTIALKNSAKVSSLSSSRAKNDLARAKGLEAKIDSINKGPGTATSKAALVDAAKTTFDARSSVIEARRSSVDTSRDAKIELERKDREKEKRAQTKAAFGATAVSTGVGAIAGSLDAGPAKSAMNSFTSSMSLAASAVSALPPKIGIIVGTLIAVAGFAEALIVLKSTSEALRQRAEMMKKNLEEFSSSSRSVVSAYQAYQESIYDASVSSERIVQINNEIAMSMAKLPDAYRSEFESKMRNAGSQGERVNIQSEMQSRMSKDTFVTERLAESSSKTDFGIFKKSFYADLLGKGSNRYTNTEIFETNDADRKRQKAELNKDVFAITDAATSTKSKEGEFRELAAANAGLDSFRQRLANLMPPEAREGIIKMKDAEMELVKARIEQVEATRRVTEMIAGVMAPQLERAREARRQAQEEINLMRERSVQLRQLASDFSTLGISMAVSSQNVKTKAGTKRLTLLSDEMKGQTGEQTGARIEARMQQIQGLSEAIQTQRTEASKAIRQSLGRGTKSPGEGQPAILSEQEARTNVNISRVIENAMGNIDLGLFTDPNKLIEEIISKTEGTQDKQEVRKRFASDPSLISNLQMIVSNTAQANTELEINRALQEKMLLEVAKSQQDKKMFGGIENFLSKSKRKDDAKEFSKSLSMLGSKTSERRGEGAMRLILQAQKDLGGSLSRDTKAGKDLEDMSIEGRTAQIERTATSRINKVKKNRRLTQPQKDSLIASYSEQRDRAKEIATKQVRDATRLETATLDQLDKIISSDQSLTDIKTILTNGQQLVKIAGNSGQFSAQAADKAKETEAQTKQKTDEERIKGDARTNVNQIVSELLNDEEFAKGTKGKSPEKIKEDFKRELDKRFRPGNESADRNIEQAKRTANRTGSDADKKIVTDLEKRRDADRAMQAEARDTNINQYRPKEVIEEAEKKRKADKQKKDSESNLTSYALAAIAGVATAVVLRKPQLAMPALKALASKIPGLARRFPSLAPGPRIPTGGIPVGPPAPGTPLPPSYSRPALLPPRVLPPGPPAPGTPLPPSYSRSAQLPPGVLPPGAVVPPGPVRLPGGPVAPAAGVLSKAAEALKAASPSLFKAASKVGGALSSKLPLIGGAITGYMEYDKRKGEGRSTGEAVALGVGKGALVTAGGIVGAALGTTLIPILGPFGPILGGMIGSVAADYLFDGAASAAEMLGNAMGGMNDEVTAQSNEFDRASEERSQRVAASEGFSSSTSEGVAAALKDAGMEEQAADEASKKLGVFTDQGGTRWTRSNIDQILSNPDTDPNSRLAKRAKSALSAIERQEKDAVADQVDLTANNDKEAQAVALEKADADSKEKARVEAVRKAEIKYGVGNGERGLKREEALAQGSQEDKLKRMEIGAALLRNQTDKYQVNQEVKNFEATGDKTSPGYLEAKAKQNYLNRSGQLDSRGNIPSSSPGFQEDPSKKIVLESSKSTTALDSSKLNTEALKKLTEVLSGFGDQTWNPQGGESSNGNDYSELKNELAKMSEELSGLSLALSKSVSSGGSLEVIVSGGEDGTQELTFRNIRQAREAISELGERMAALESANNRSAPTPEDFA